MPTLRKVNEVSKHLQLLYTGNIIIRAWNRDGPSQRTLVTTIFSVCDTSHLQLDCLYIVPVAIATNSQLTVSIPNEQ